MIWYFICAALIFAALYAFLLRPARVMPEQVKPFRGRTYAHRGLYSQHSNVPENSLEAFEIAARHGYGVELDVRCSADGKPIVFHDEMLSRLCGIPKAVEDLTAEQITKLRIMTSEQCIPTLQEALAQIAGRVPVILELKTGKKNREKLCRAAAEILLDYSGDVCVASFDPLSLYWFRRHFPDCMRLQLATSMKKRQMNPVSKYLLENLMLNCLSRPHIVGYEHDFAQNRHFRRCYTRFGALSCLFTVENQTEFDNCTKLAGMVVFDRFFPKPRFDALKVVNGKVARGD